MTVVAIQSAIYAALAGAAGLNTLVGARIYPDVAPQEVAVPFCVWQEISLDKVSNDLQGSSETDGLDNFRIQITSWASGPGGSSMARAVDEQVRLAMIAATGFKSLHSDSRAMPFEPETKRFGFQSDFSVWLRT